jgi:hypothetical protein
MVTPKSEEDVGVPLTLSVSFLFGIFPCGVYHGGFFISIIPKNYSSWKKH